MNKENLLKIASEFVYRSKENYIIKEIAISENVVGMKIFEAPIFGYASSEDECFTLFKKPSVIGEHFLLPREWLPQSKTVISFFLPFSEAVKRGNGRDSAWPSEEWLHGRIEGQAFINKLCKYLKAELINAGYNSLVPALEERFWAKTALKGGLVHPEASFTSNWSERHAAFVCGLGTFGLSKGLITAKGVAGRFGSIITELYLPPDKREYENIYEYCSMCGACVKKCPVNAISIEDGKNHMICSKFLDQTAEKYKPRYGCGKCQIGVPCEGKIPKQHKIK
ncbi:4Fe-4S binding protein [Clostridium bowmanii]|uniref:4Fe-4S binding protein n=1 Tax=Clostridium bowmanii TaxID=132925 RepID=UPI001C0B559D|nr:4Fe-4S binding protein [Clostridium bowmanii]MBU3189985.1 4Fe-4S binding protein [Clostridium bowmanii]MCA1074581.1 4Fe-4S binding protein [Clostridium bowmanii]